MSKGWIAKLGEVLEGEFVEEQALSAFPEPPHGLAYFIYQGHAYVLHPNKYELEVEPGHEMHDPSKPVTRFRLRFVGLARRVATL